MNTVTIPRKLPTKGELVLVSREEYESLRAQAEGREFTPTKADLKALERARKNFKAGKTISYDEFARRVDARR
ncbi:hypothetical protein HY968_03910 [Candidatus Kaiserbacteria bacterium]|nr:hypothetical protein [Candidatus Kaiserbacteria bacterium]